MEWSVMPGYEITTIGIPVMAASHIRKVGPGVWKSLCPRNHPAAALPRWICDLLGLQGLKVFLTIASPMLVSQLATLTLRA
jgi:hypothetical protein